MFVDTVIADRAELDECSCNCGRDRCGWRFSRLASETCRARNETREPVERWKFDGYQDLEAAMRRDIADVSWWFDTSQLTPTETSARLVAELAERAPVL